MIRIFAAHGFDRLHDGDSLVEVVGLLNDRERLADRSVSLGAGGPKDALVALGRA